MTSVSIRKSKKHLLILMASLTIATTAYCQDHQVKMDQVNTIVRILSSHVDVSKIKKQIPLLPFLVEDILDNNSKNGELTIAGVKIKQILSTDKDFAFHANDILLGIDNIRLKSSSHLYELLPEFNQIENVLFRVMRKGSVKEIRIPLNIQPPGIIADLFIEEAKFETFNYANKIVLSSALVLKYTADELAFFLAHEMGHLLLNHQQHLDREGSAVLGELFLGMALKTVSTHAGPVTTGAGYTLAPHSQINEKEADIFAINLLKESGFDSAVGYALLRSAQSSQDAESYFNSHLMNERRLEILNDLLERLQSVDSQTPSKKHLFKPSRDYENPKVDLGAVMNSGAFHDEFALRSVRILSVEGFHDSATSSGLVFYNGEFEKLQWRASIKDNWSFFKSGNIKIDLHNPSGEKISECKDSYVVFKGDASEASCTINMKNLRRDGDDGVWRMRVFRGKDHIDDRHFLITDRIRSKKFRRKRSK